MDSTLSGVGVLDKVMAILRSIEDEPRSLAALVSDTGLPRPTAHRLATALEDHGLVRRDGEGRFVLGFSLLALGRAAGEAYPLSDAARPALVRLADQTGESVQLYVVEGAMRRCVASLESSHGLRTIVPLGALLTMEVGSAAEVLSEPLVGRSSGWAQSVGAREAGVASVSAAVVDAGIAVAAVSVSGPIERTTSQPGSVYGPLVAEAARAIETSAGLTGPP
jgi:DNA-binding IclR family transcriptional regulator